MQSLNVGIIGTGNIAPAYIRGCAPFDVIKIVACADILPDRAQSFGSEHGIAACSVDDMLARDDIDIVINLTIPLAHAEVSLRILEAGKHAYCEKAAGGRPCRRRPGRQRGQGSRAAYRLRARHLPWRRRADSAQSDRRWRDWRAGGGHSFLAEPRPRALAPQRRLLLSQRRRTPFRYGTLLFDRPRQSDGPGGASLQLGAADFLRTQSPPAMRLWASGCRWRSTRMSRVHSNFKAAPLPRSF